MNFVDATATTALDAKTFATLRARAALLGCTLMRTDGERGREVFVIARGALCKELEGAEELDAWLQRLGGAAA